MDEEEQMVNDNDILMENGNIVEANSKTNHVRWEAIDNQTLFLNS